MIKFSVLLPTYNRLEYLKHAVSSVCRQAYETWEIIISDNQSTDDVKGYIQSLGDDRIKYFRTSSFLSVTENWNQAMEKSSGDYVIMLGDDDCLLKDYFLICASLINKHSSPDLIYTSALNYVYPNVIPGCPQGCLVVWSNASFLRNQLSPFVLDKKTAHSLVDKALNFTIMFNFNAQFSLISRTLINQLKKYGDFYQSPYPDYYSTTALFLKANRILAVNLPMTVISISPKSFGFYYFNNKEKEGIEMLNNMAHDEVYKSMQKYLLPGTNMNSSWLLSMETVKKNFGKEFPLRVNYKKYRFLQVLISYKKYCFNENVHKKDLWKIFKCLFWWEKILYLLSFCILNRLTSIRSVKNWVQSFPYAFSHPTHGENKVLSHSYQNTSEVFDNVDLNELDGYKKCLEEFPLSTTH